MEALNINLEALKSLPWSELQKIREAVNLAICTKPEFDVDAPKGEK